MDVFTPSGNTCSSFKRRRRQIWAALLKKVWDGDALKCPKCGGRMKVISFEIDWEKYAVSEN